MTIEFQGFLTEVQASYPDATVTDGNLVVFRYQIPVGSRIGDEIQLGFAHVDDWPLSCPPGPHLSPRLGHPDGSVHTSPLGDDWEYWSRPFPGWADTDRAFRTYMGHVRALLMRLT